MTGRVAEQRVLDPVDSGLALRSGRIRVAGLSCVADAVGLERRLRQAEGVEQVLVNPVTEIAYVEFDAARVTMPSLASAIEHAGFAAAILE